MNNLIYMFQLFFDNTFQLSSQLQFLWFMSYWKIYLHKKESDCWVKTRRMGIKATASSENKLFQFLSITKNLLCCAAKKIESFSSGVFSQLCHSHLLSRERVKFLTRRMLEWKLRDGQVNKGGYNMSDGETKLRWKWFYAEKCFFALCWFKILYINVILINNTVTWWIKQI